MNIEYAVFNIEYAILNIEYARLNIHFAGLSIGSAVFAGYPIGFLCQIPATGVAVQPTAR